MDETLVSAWKAHQDIDPYFQQRKSDFSFMFNKYKIEVKLRPFVIECLERLAEIYEIVIYTAGVQGYADPILNYIDPTNSLITKRLYRQDCIVFQNNLGGTWYIKDLDVFLDRQKEDIVIVDNSIHSFGFDLDNGVPIQSFVYN